MLCANDTIASLAKTAKASATKIFVIDTTTDFSSITFTEVASGDVVGVYSTTYLKTGAGVYYKKYSA